MDRHVPRPRAQTALVLAPLGLLALVIMLDALDNRGVEALPVVVFITLGVVTTVIGGRLWLRRPANGTGRLLVVLGGTLILGASGNLTSDWASLPGALFPALALPALVHVVLAFPAGVLRGRPARAVLAVAYPTVAIGGVLAHVLGGPGDAPLTAPGHAWAAQVIAETTAIILRGCLAAAFALMALRWWQLRPVMGRRPVGLVYLSGALALITLVGGVYLRRLVGWNELEYFLFQITAICAFPIVVAAALRRGVLARTADVTELAAWFAAPADRLRPRDALARALGDPSLELRFAFPAGAGTYVDDAGRPVDAPVPTPTRGVVPVGDPPRAVVVYDTVLIADPAPVVAAARVAALAIDRERLGAELHASETELRESRRRIVTVGEEGRRRLAQDLHDGVQARLVVAALGAGRLVDRLRGGGDVADLPEQLDAVRGEVDRSITELRRVVEGVLPALLREQGLFAALDEYVLGVPLPTRLQVEGDDAALDPAVATAAYFVAQEAVLNTLKHARATRVEVRAVVGVGLLRVEVGDDGVGGADEARPGVGLLGMRDRVGALGGQVRVHSPAGGGTTVSVELPCGW